MNQENFYNVLPLLSSNYFYTVTEWIEITRNESYFYFPGTNQTQYPSKSVWIS